MKGLAHPSHCDLKEKESVDELSSGDESEEYDSDDEGQSGYRKGGYHPVKIGEKYCNRYVIEKKTRLGALLNCLVGIRLQCVRRQHSQARCY